MQKLAIFSMLSQPFLRRKVTALLQYTKSVEKMQGLTNVKMFPEILKKGLQFRFFVLYYLYLGKFLLEVIDMKKAIAILLTLVLVFGLAVPAFAAKSPNGQVYHKVVIIQGNAHADAPADAKPENVTYTTVVDGNAIVAKADPALGEFNGWTLFKADGKPAVLGVDYKFDGAFSLNDTEIRIIPLTTIVVAANYDDVKTETIIIDEEEDESPETGDSMIAVLSAVAALALCGAVVSKKQLAK